MIALEDRQALVRDITLAHQAGARLQAACTTAGITLRTLQRWQAGAGLLAGDGRPAAQRPTPVSAIGILEPLRDRRIGARA